MNPLSADVMRTVSVLIVDRSRFMRGLIADLLRAAGIEQIHFATESQQALEQLRSWRPAVTFIERELEPVSGVELVRLIRAPDSLAERTVPIVLMTASNRQADILEARDAGATEIVIKPVTPRAVFSRLAAILRNERKFVESAEYVGPCRRRKRGEYEGPLRRLEDPDDMEDAFDVDRAAYFARVSGLIDTLSSLARSLDPTERRDVRTVLETTAKLAETGKSASDARIVQAGRSLERYVRGVGATGRLDVDIIHVHLAGLARLVELTDSHDAVRGAVADDLASIVDKCLERRGAA